MSLSDGARKLLLKIVSTTKEGGREPFRLMKRSHSSGSRGYAIVYSDGKPISTESDQFDLQELEEAGFVRSSSDGKLFTVAKLTQSGWEAGTRLSAIGHPLVVQDMPSPPYGTQPPFSDAIDEIAGCRLGLLPALPSTPPMPERAKTEPKRIFIGHGGRNDWYPLLPFLQSIGLEGREFNLRPSAGLLTTNVLHEMLDAASAAIIVVTAEDKHENGKVYPRLNVVHEIGLCHAKFRVEKTILLVEEGCELFSNIAGLTYIPFRRDHIRDKFWELREALRRENIIL